jgi:alpha-1,2-mannosyltransferase
MTATPAPRRRPLVRVARLITLAAAFGWAAYVLASWVLLWNPADAGAYYDAAVRLSQGEPLYLPIHPEAHEVYRYAPWFAYAWIPLTLVPRDVALHAWSLAMLACSIVAVWPLLRRGTPAALALGALLGAFLAETAMFGNAHPAVVAILVLGARSRWMPLAVGIAASIKLVPILFVAPWIRAGEWTKAPVAVGVAVALWAPALLFDLSGYETDPGTGLLSFYAVSPVLWVALAVVSGSAALLAVARRSRWAWVAIGLFMFVGPPRVALSYLGFLIPAIVMTWAEDAENGG